MSRRGFTTIEILVAMTISLLLLIVLGAFLVMTLHSAAKGTVRVSMEQDAVFAMQQVVADLEATSANGFSFAPAAGNTAPLVFAIVRLNNVLPDGSQQWEPKAIVYTWDQPGGVLARSAVTPPSGALDETKPVQFSAADLTTMSTTANPLIHDVTACSVQVSGATVTVSLTLQRQAATGSGSPQTFQATRTVSLRN